MPQFNRHTGFLSGLRRNWYNETNQAYQDCAPGYCRVMLTDGTIISDHTNAQTVIAGEDMCAWLNNDTREVCDTHGRVFPGADLDAWDGQLPSIGPSGEYALKTIRDSFGPWEVITLSGRKLLTFGDAKHIQFLDFDECIWMEGRIPQSNFNLKFPDKLVYSYRVILLANGYSFLYQRVSDGALICDGKKIGGEGNYFYYDYQYRNGKRRITWSTDPGDVNAILVEYTDEEFSQLPNADETVPPVIPPTKPPIKPVEKVFPPLKVMKLDTKIVAIKGPAGKYGRADVKGSGPFAGLGWYGIIWDRDTPDEDCKFELSKPDNRHELKHLKTDALLGIDATQYSGDIGKQFYLKPGDRGAYESPVIFQGTLNGFLLGVVEYDTYPSCAFAVEVL